MDKDGKSKIKFITNPDTEGKVIDMSVLATKTLSRKEKLAKAQRLSNSITERTTKAGLTQGKIKKDVRKAFNDVKSNRRSGRS